MADVFTFRKAAGFAWMLVMGSWWVNEVPLWVVAATISNEDGGWQAALFVAFGLGVFAFLVGYIGYLIGWESGR